VCLSRSTIWRLEQGRVPETCQGLSERGGVVQDEVEAWIQSKLIAYHFLAAIIPASQAAANFTHERIQS